MKTAPGLAADIRRSSTWKARSMLWRSEVSASPIETQVSVTTQSAPATASIGSVTMRTLAPRACAQSTTSLGGSRISGHATLSSKSNIAAAWIHEVAMLLPSPDQVMRLPLMGPRCSSKVMTSAISWHGWVRSVRPLMTGT